MKALVVVTGIGYGDSTREEANIKEIKKQFPRSKIVVAGYDNSYDYFKKKYKTVRIQGYKLPGKKLKIQLPSFVLSNIFLPLFWFTGTLKVQLENFNFKPDIIISDFEPVGISLARLLRKKCIVVFGYDPMLYREYKKKNKVNLKMKTEATYFEYLYSQANLVVVPTLRKIRKRKLDYSYINPIIRKEPKELPSEAKIMKQLNIKKKPIVVMLGGSQFGTTLAKNINQLADNYKENFIIFGGKLEDIKFKKNVKYIKFTKDFLKYLKISKGVITLGGQITLAEALIYKKPVLCFPIKDHVEQVLNAYSIKRIAMISQKSSVKSLKGILPRFIKNIPNLKKKVVKYNLQNGGSEELINVIKIALEK